MNTFTYDVIVLGCLIVVWVMYVWGLIPIRKKKKD